MERRGFLASLGALLAAPVSEFRPTIAPGRLASFSGLANYVASPAQICEFTPVVDQVALDDIGRRIDEIRHSAGLLDPRDPPYGSAAWFFG
jgi:hypothetical protein